MVFSGSVDLLGYVSLITVVKDDPKGFSKTYDSFCKASLLAKFEVIVFDSSVHDFNIKEVILQQEASYPNLKCRYYWRAPNGIYPAMNKCMDFCTSKFVQFINSGDCLNAKNWLNFILLSQSACSTKLYYGHTSWNTKTGRVGLVLPLEFQKKLVPYLGRMPNHQCMLIPTDLQRSHPYKSSRYPVAADLEFKHYANTQYILFDTGLTIVVSEPGGASQKISTLTQLYCRAKEFSQIQLRYKGVLSGVITFLIFFFWHSRKIFFFHFQRVCSRV